MSEPSATATQATAIARPLDELVRLIQDDLRQGREAAERAAMPYYRAAGEKLIEAKSQMEHGAFLPWVARHFKIRKNQASVYMALAAAYANEKSGAPDFVSLRDFERTTGRRPASQQSAGRVDSAPLNLAAEEMKQAGERELQRKLGLRLITIGYKALARELHPDKGGSREAMTRLNAERDRLKLRA
jgi:DUF3102 family protein